MSRARDISRLSSNQALSVDNNLNIGIGSTQPTSKLNVVGVVSASSFVGNVTGTATGLSGTPNLNVGVVTAQTFFSNPNIISEAYVLNNPNHNYGMFGPVSVAATITVGVGNTFVIV